MLIQSGDIQKSTLYFEKKIHNKENVVDFPQRLFFYSFNNFLSLGGSCSEILLI